jgi:hypothetical protein
MVIVVQIISTVFTITSENSKHYVRHTRWSSEDREPERSRKSVDVGYDFLPIKLSKSVSADCYTCRTDSTINLLTSDDNREKYTDKIRVPICVSEIHFTAIELLCILEFMRGDG